MLNTDGTKKRLGYAKCLHLKQYVQACQVKQTRVNPKQYCPSDRYKCSSATKIRIKLLVFLHLGAMGSSSYHDARPLLPAFTVIDVGFS